VNDAKPTAEFASIVYGEGGVPLDDPAEAFHEASALHPDVAPPSLAAMLELARDPVLQQTVARASYARAHLPGVDLPAAALGDARLETAVAARRSRRPEVPLPLPVAALASILACAYRSSGGRRPVPSGGALYPLELYVAALAVDGVGSGVYHYDPFRHRLARLGAAVRADVGLALVEPVLVETAAAVLVVTAMFWRTRFKYGLRGYRFAVLEAGHAAQNALLAAAALDVAALPVGGFYDRRLDALVGADGLEQASLYALVLGGRA
jgi:SagB-type dehydrogenase family enzyme